MEANKVAPLMMMETDSVSEMLYLLVFWDSGQCTKSRNPVILSVIHHRQNP
jgi:hypothetical protein